MPKALANRPKLQHHLNYTMQVFWEMSDTRQQAMSGVNNLTLAEFNAYCLHHRLGYYEAQDLWWGVKVLDRAYRTYKAEKADKKPA